MLVECIYTSVAAQPWTRDELLELLSSARRHNSTHDITGLLLYCGSATEFLQVLEGPAAAVDALMKSIREDARHRSVNVLREGPLAERRFARWHMAFRLAEDLPVGEPTRPSGLWPAGGFSDMDFEAGVERARELFENANRSLAS